MCAPSMLGRTNHGSECAQRGAIRNGDYRRCAAAFVSLKEEMSIQAELRRIVESREVLSFDEAAALMRRVLAGEAADVELAALLGALAGRGETAAEIAGFATAMREAATMLPLTE